MCELFAMSSLHPTVITFSLNEFSKHGGLTGPHKDGWGVAFYEGNAVRIVKDESSASNSPCMNFVKSRRLKSKIIISHIRRATQGKISYRNTQPFQRELAGRMHTFAHNGNLKGIDTSSNVKLKQYHPVGEMDSEFVFCYLMDLLNDIWRYDCRPTIKKRISLISDYANTISEFGPANFIYSDGELCFAHGHIRKHEGKIGFHPPGLYMLCRSCQREQEAESIEGLRFDETYQSQNVTLVASVPLTNEKWKPLAEGKLLVLKYGKPVDIETVMGRNVVR